MERARAAGSRLCLRGRSGQEGDPYATDRVRGGAASRRLCRLCLAGGRQEDVGEGGRIDGAYGLNSRQQEWSRPPEPHPPQAGYWCSRFARRPNVSLIWCGNDQVTEAGSNLGYRNSLRSFAYAPLNLALDPNIPM